MSARPSPSKSTACFRNEVGRNCGWPSAPAHDDFIASRAGQPAFHHFQRRQQLRRGTSPCASPGTPWCRAPRRRRKGFSPRRSRIRGPRSPAPRRPARRSVSRSPPSVLAFCPARARPPPVTAPMSCRRNSCRASRTPPGAASSASSALAPGITRSGNFRLGFTPSNAASKVFFDTPFALASGHRSLASQARNWSSIFAAEAGGGKNNAEHASMISGSALRCPPLSCRTSPPQGGRLACRAVSQISTTAESCEIETANLPPCGGDVRQDRGGQRRALFI